MSDRDDERKTGDQNEARRMSSKSATQTPTTTLPSSNRSKRRATRACDRCKLKKMRCTGKNPCAHCVTVKAPCEFNAKYTRGKAPQIESASQREQRQYLAALGWKPGMSSARRNSRDTSSSCPSSPDPVEQRGREPEPAEQGSEPPSGATIFRRTQDNLNHLNPPANSSQRVPVSAFGDPPLPEVDHTFLVLPPPDIARDLVAKYFEVVAPINQFLHHPTVQKWFDNVLRGFREGQVVRNSKKAIVLLVIASSYNFTEISSKEEDSNLSFRYFQAAEHLLNTDTGPILIECIQARLIQCFYLLSRSRINQAWSTFGIVVNQIFATDIHRKAKSERTASENWINTECSKRTFWCAYTLDKYLSSALGRPQQLRDEDIDQEFPQLVNDEHLSATSYMVTTDHLHSTIMATVCQIQLATVLSSIIKELYCIRPPSFETRLALSQKHKEKLMAVAMKFMPFVEQDVSGLRVLFSRQVVGVRLGYANILIVLYRPFLFDTPDPSLPVDLRDKCEENVFECLKAAISITGYVDRLCQSDAFFEAAWFVHFCGYNAIVALYVFVIKRHTGPAESWQPLLKAGEKCQSQLKIAGEKESFSQKCSQVLEELHTEAVSRIQKYERSQKGDGDAGPQRRDEKLRESFETGEKRHHQPQYSETFASNPARETNRQPARVPDITYGNANEWQDVNFDRFAPGGGILGSMDWIQNQSSSKSIVDQIEQWGFSSPTGWA